MRILLKLKQRLNHYTVIVSRLISSLK
jgi:hypothetical protein